MLAELAAANAAFSVIKNFVSNGKELASCGKQIGDFVFAKEQIEKKASKQSATGVRRNDIEEFMDLEKKILSDITVHMKYARYLEDKQRRENWDELVTRNMNMHIKKFPHIEEEIRENYKMVFDKKVLPSMRSMQFGGKPIEVSPNRVFNCAFAPADDPRVFGEIMFLLLGGTGVGYSVQKHHVDRLPEIHRPSTKRTRRFLIGDSIEGWADAVKALVQSYFKGTSKLRFDFSDI